MTVPFTSGQAYLAKVGMKELSSIETEMWVLADEIEATDAGVFWLHILEVLPSVTGSDICVIKQSFIDPDGGQTDKPKKIIRAQSLRAKLRRFGHELVMETS